MADTRTALDVATEQLYHARQELAIHEDLVQAALFNLEAALMKRRAATVLVEDLERLHFNLGG